MQIESKENKQTQTGKPMIVFTIDGKRYNTFDMDLNKYNAGDHVAVKFTQNGKYTNIESMTDGSEEQTKNEASQPSNQGIAVSTVMNMTDKPHSYEMGKAGNRHKIYYNTVRELIEHIQSLEENDLLDSESLETKPEDFGKE